MPKFTEQQFIEEIQKASISGDREIEGEYITDDGRTITYGYDFNYLEIGKWSACFVRWFDEDLTPEGEFYDAYPRYAEEWQIEGLIEVYDEENHELSRGDIIDLLVKHTTLNCIPF